VWQKIGSPYIQLVHSAREFHVLGGVITLKGKPIRFVGDRIPSKGISPYAVLFSPLLGWTWKEVKFCDDGVAMAAEKNAQTSTGEYWIPSQTVLTASVITKHLPRLLYLSTVLVKFCAEKPCKGEDLFKKVGRLIGEKMTTPGDAELALHWCLVAMQLESNKTNQGLVAFDMTGAMCSDQTFQSWTHRQVELTLWPAHTSTAQHQTISQPVLDPTTIMGAIAVQFGAQMATMMQATENGGSTSQQQLQQRA